jgi:Zn-dependent protease
MKTLHGIRFLPLARVSGTLLGLDARWLGTRGLMLSLILVLFTPGGPLNHDSDTPVWTKIAIGLSSLLAVALTSFGHELGHALAGRLAGLPVRAIVLAPEGAVTIRETSDEPRINFRTALAGPLANALLGTACAILAGLVPDTFLSTFLGEVGGLQLLTGVANLLPVGPMDGSNILASWRACRAVA